MPRRRESGLDLLIALPWYVGAAIAIGLYFGAPVLAGLITSSSPILVKSHHAVAGIFRLLSYLVAAAAALSALRSYFVRQKFASQRSLADLRALTWQQFEMIVGEAFRRQCYSVLETGLGGADGGVDLVLSRGGQRFLVQCKQYRASTVSVMVVREIFGVVAARKAAGAIVVTTGTFTKDAVDFARGQPIELIDGAKLEAMVRDIHGTPTTSSSAPATGSSSSSRPASPAASSSAAAVACPNCASPMVLRTGRGKGGSQFWGCSTFPRCRGTRPV
jgi:restriction system protein